MTLQPLHRFAVPDAPVQPALGEPCNGCGVCCLAEPCPLGMVLTRRFSGACKLLWWDAGCRQYRCGAVQAPLGPSTQTSAAALRWWRGLAYRWISAGTGCDCLLHAQTTDPPTKPSDEA